MQNSRSRFRSRRKEERTATPGGANAVEEASEVAALNGRWTGYHPSLDDAMNAALLNGLRKTQGGGGDDA